MKKIFLLGNPNVGKTTLFNTLSKRNEETGNYSGTTLLTQEAEIFLNDEKIVIVDIPGMYGGEKPKEEEKVAWKTLENAMEEENALFVQVLNPEILEQSLVLSLSLKKKGIPLVLFLNEKNEENQDETSKKNVEEIKKKIEENLCVGVFSGNAADKNLAKNFWEKLKNAQEQKNFKLCSLTEVELLEKIGKNSFFHQKRKSWLQNWIPNRMRNDEGIDAFLLHPLFGIAIFAVVMWAMFQIVFTVGAIPMDYIDAGTVLVQETGKKFFGENLLSLLIFDGIVAGVGATLMFLPNIFLLFFGLSLLKESGYLARSSFLLNGFFKKIGLSGRVSVPLLMGFGCNVPSVMAISTLESQKEKISVAMMSLFMSCGARLPVYTLLIGAFIPNAFQGFLLFCIYLLGILVAFFTGKILNDFYPHKEQKLMLQMPKYQKPSSKKAVQFAMMQGKDFFQRVWKFIVPVSILLWIVFTFPLHEVEKNGIESSYGAQMAQTVQPIFEPLGFDWTMTAGIFAGLAAKEVMVANFAQIYHQESEENLAEHLKSLPQFSIPSVLALLVFTLLYMPCVAVIATIKAQLGTKWAIIGSVYPTVVAWILAFFVFQISRFFLG